MDGVLVELSGFYGMMRVYFVPSSVAPTRRPAAERKAARKRTEEGWPVHSFQTLLKDLATITQNRVRLGEQSFEMLAAPTPLQRRAFELLELPCR